MPIIRADSWSTTKAMSVALPCFPLLGGGSPTCALGGQGANPEEGGKGNSPFPFPTSLGPTPLLIIPETPLVDLQRTRSDQGKTDPRG